MISIYFREQKRYTQEDLRKAFNCPEDKIVHYIKILKKYEVLKAVKLNLDQRDLTDLLDEDIVVSDVEADDNIHYYVFRFVGIISIEGIVLKIYPKYISKKDEPIGELKQVIKVLEKYNNSKEQIIKIFNETEDFDSFNLLAMLLYFVRDYHENGSYTNEQIVLEENGSGEIFWDKTINEAFTYISGGKPYYPTLYTKKRIQDDYDFFKRLHECIVTRCSKELEDSDLLELFDITNIYLTDEVLDDFGDKDYILTRINNEINVQFNTRKQNLLKMMYAYISKNGKLENNNYLSMFGTFAFNLVWEEACKKVFNNQLDTRLKNIPLVNGLNEKYRNKKYTNLLSVIGKPKWIGNRENGTVYEIESSTLIPDTITIHNNTMYIFDAKYYCLQFDEKRINGQPGIESITKQYLYQLAYTEFVQLNGIEDVKNCFLMPTEEDYVQKPGIVRLEMLLALNLTDIQIRMLPAKIVYDLYLSNDLYLIDKLL